jgi:hypothetical protein
MKKQDLQNFISKFHLGGAVDSVKLKTENGKAVTDIVNDQKILIGKVTHKDIDIEPGEYGLYNLTQFNRFVSVMDEDVNIAVNKNNEIATSINLNDNVTDVNYILADLAVIPMVPKLKAIPDFEVTLNIDKDFVDRFLKSNNIIVDSEYFTLESNGTGLNVIFGYNANINTSRIKFKVAMDALSGDLEPTSFSSKIFRELLVANKDFKEAKMKVSGKGLLKITFKDDNYSAEYFLIASNVNN